MLDATLGYPLRGVAFFHRGHRLEIVGTGSTKALQE